MAHIQDFPLNVKIFNITKLIENDLLAVDLTWSLFVSTAEHYKVDSLLRPFPPIFIDKFGIKNVNALRDIIRATPPIPDLEKALRNGAVSSKLVELFHWLLVEQHFSLHSLKEHELNSVLNSINGYSTSPRYVFEVRLSSASSKRCADEIDQYGSLLAYHGGCVENVYSILQHGLQSAMARDETLFGAGIYLSTAMSVSSHFSSRGMLWSSSVLGNVGSTIAVVEVARHPSVLAQESGQQEGVLRHQQKNMPGKYILVENSDLVRLRYIILYVTKEAPAEGMWRFTALALAALVFLYLMWKLLFR